MLVLQAFAAVATIATVAKSFPINPDGSAAIQGRSAIGFSNEVKAMMKRDQLDTASLAEHYGYSKRANADEPDTLVAQTEKDQPNKREAEPKELYGGLAPSCDTDDEDPDTLATKTE